MSTNNPMDLCEDMFGDPSASVGSSQPYADEDWNNVDDEAVTDVLKIDLEMGNGRKVKQDMAEILRIRYTDDPTLLVRDMASAPGYYCYWATLQAEAEFDLVNANTEYEIMFGWYYSIAKQFLESKDPTGKSKIIATDIKSQIPSLFDRPRKWNKEKYRFVVDIDETVDYNDIIELPSYRELVGKKAIAQHRVSTIKAQVQSMGFRVQLLPSQQSLLKRLYERPE